MVLPTLNEGGTIVTLIQEILENRNFPPDTHVIVVDDGSTDGTPTKVQELGQFDSRVRLIERKREKNLPSAIKKGIQATDSQFVAWLDTDGSMPISDLERLWQISSSTNSVVIASRYVEGGGMKGQTNSVRKYRSIRKELKGTQDSIIAVVLSRFMNVLIRRLLRTEVKDITSGFIVIPRIHLDLGCFESQYGEYFLKLIHGLDQKGVTIREIPYCNLPRMYGESKTGSNILEFIRRGLPYLAFGIQTYIKVERV